MPEQFREGVLAKMTEAGLPNLITYEIAGESQLPPLQALMYGYVMTGDGVMIRARRQGLEVCLPVAVSPSPITGLAAVEPFVALPGGRVPAALVTRMLERSRAVCRSAADVDFLESLFYLSYDEESGEWKLAESAQERHHSTVRPRDDSAGSDYAQALIEVHTHPRGYPDFSEQDDEEEQGKFRVFAVCSDLFEHTSLRVRVGIFEHFCEIPAEWVFEVPEEGSARPEIEESSASIA
jgi:proteasome lid subunit RPN8/RPN11